MAIKWSYLKLSIKLVFNFSVERFLKSRAILSFLKGGLRIQVQSVWIFISVQTSTPLGGVFSKTFQNKTKRNQHENIDQDLGYMHVLKYLRCKNSFWKIVTLIIISVRPTIINWLHLKQFNLDPVVSLTTLKNPLSIFANSVQTLALSGHNNDSYTSAIACHANNVHKSICPIGKTPRLSLLFII